MDLCEKILALVLGQMFRKKRSNVIEYEGAQKAGAIQSTREQGSKNIKELRVRIVLFADQSPGGSWRGGLLDGSPCTQGLEEIP